MKIQNILLLVSMSLATVGLYPAAQGPEDKKAEEVYKNIKVLKGIPASDVIPSMQFMSASLKVECEFCHKGEDFADDSVRAKEATRHMIEMQKDINTKNFNGRPQVSCNTCHNGSPNPSRVPAIEGISRRTINRNATAVPVADVLKKFQSSTGDLKTVKLEGTVKGFGPSAVPVKVAQGSPNKFLIEMGGRQFGFDGTETWMGEGGKASLVPAENAKELQNFGRFFRGEKALDYFGELRFAGTDKIDGKEVVVLRSGAQGAKVTADLYFDSASGLLARIVTYTTTSLGSMPSSVDFGDYHKVGDAMVPYLVKKSGGKEPLVFEFTKSEANPVLPATYFSRSKE